MRSRFGALVAALALLVGSTANAAIYSLDTYPTYPITPSSLGLNLNISNLIVVPSGNATGTISGGFLVGDLTGSATADVSLDGTNSGLLDITGSSFTLSALSVTQSGTLFGIFPYSIALTSTAIGVELTGGPITVTNGTFSIDSLTPGSLALNSGSLNYNIVIAALGVNENGSIDLSSSPIAVSFSSLGAVTIPGTAVVNVDESADVSIDFSGITVASDLALNESTNLPITITLTGGVNLHGIQTIPEAGSMILAGLATVGMASFVFRRRRSA